MIAAATAMKHCPPPDFVPRRPALGLPDLACDCHAHVIGPHADYPLSSKRIYTPPDCMEQAYLAMLDAIGVARAVLVQPSVYDKDNALLLDTLARHPDRLRGVAVIEPDESEATLRSMHAAGVRGVRVNLVDRRAQASTLPLEELHALALRVAPLGWHIELLVHVDEHAEMLPSLGELSVPVVFGHFGYLNIGGDAHDPGLRAVIALMRQGRAWVKMTGPYRLTRRPLPYVDCDAYAHVLREAAPERLLWGTDWPHVMLSGVMPNDAELVELLARWLPTSELREQVLVRNPEALYGFPSTLG